MTTPFYPGQTDYIDQLNLLWDRATTSVIGTSTSSIVVSNGSKSLTTQANLQFTVGSEIKVTSTASPSNYLLGQVTAYTQLTGEMTFTGTATGSGTFTAWSISLSGAQGPQGPTGPTGLTGPANSLVIGTVTSGTAAATITGTAPSQTLNLTLPPGPANSLSIGTVVQGIAGATITGTAPTQTLNLTLPKGDKGTIFRGAWVTATNYAVDDLTTNAGRTYICILTATGLGTVPGSDATHWTLFADKGADGTGANVQVLEEGVSLTTAVTSMNFVGARLTATNSGTSVTVTTNDQTITLTGDVTGSGTGSFAATIATDAVTTTKILNANVTAGKLASDAVTTVKILDSNVTTAKIADANVTTVKILDANVTLAKMANMATASILGRNTAGTGVPEVLSAATTKTLLALDNVTNTSDANKPVSTAQQAALDLKASLVGTETLTNKRINPRFATITTSATPGPTGDTIDYFTVTALAGSATFAAPTGTPVEGQKIVFRIKDNGTARALTFNAIYRASTDLAVPTTTIVSKTLYVGFMYNATDSKWDLLATLNNF